MTALLQGLKDLQARLRLFLAYSARRAQATIDIQQGRNSE